jgi:hypothetical protein
MPLVQVFSLDADGNPVPGRGMACAKHHQPGYYSWEMRIYGMQDSIRLCGEPVLQNETRPENDLARRHGPPGAQDHPTSIERVGRTDGRELCVCNFRGPRSLVFQASVSLVAARGGERNVKHLAVGRAVWTWQADIDLGLIRFRKPIAGSRRTGSARASLFASACPPTHISIGRQILRACCCRSPQYAGALPTPQNQHLGPQQGGDQGKRPEASTATSERTETGAMSVTTPSGQLLFACPRWNRRLCVWSTLPPEAGYILCCCACRLPFWFTPRRTLRDVNSSSGPVTPVIRRL